MGFLQTMGTGYKIMGEEMKQKVVDNRANIFTGVSVVGTIATAIVSALGGAKSARQIDAKAAELGRQLTLKEKAALCWKNFLAPAGTVIGASTGAIASRVIDSGDIARLTNDVAIVSKAYSEFKKASNEVLTEKQQQDVKEKIAEKTHENIVPGEFDKLPNRGGCDLPQLFVDGFDPNIKVVSTMDKICLGITKMQKKMAELKPRVRYSYSPKINGVKWVDWLKEIGAETEVTAYKKGGLYEKYGWNKGYLEEDGTCTDDIISAYFSPGETEYMGQIRSCFVIEWDVNPSDMTLGDILKSGEV